MKIWKEKDFQYRFEDHGPKYICETENYRFGLVRFGPGQDHKKHVHRIIDEIFYVISGQADFYVNDRKYIVCPGMMIHIEPGDIHYIQNPYEEPVKMTIAATKTILPDKVEISDLSI